MQEYAGLGGRTGLGDPLLESTGIVVDNSVVWLYKKDHHAIGIRAQCLPIRTDTSSNEKKAVARGVR